MTDEPMFRGGSLRRSPDADAAVSIRLCVGDGFSDSCVCVSTAGEEDSATTGVSTFAGEVGLVVEFVLCATIIMKMKTTKPKTEMRRRFPLRRSESIEAAKPRLIPPLVVEGGVSAGGTASASGF